ncbi:MAG TPA: methyltransferase domain-containing protein [Dehalococcoidales bacterium]|nr:MAG: methyltransferase type 11 [Chloroflexi bacterium RBG_16_60_22]HJX12447.1 methyltransferase domain-containing protein [Dehalococcoidales bacterium]
MVTENRETKSARRRYDRNAALYDLMEGVVEMTRYSRWRQMLWSKVEGQEVLEVGVGTGKNFPYYPENASVTAVDFSEGMLRRARDKAARLGVRVRLLTMDVQDLRFEDASFDTVVGSFVFCSVPDPVRGLTEVARVCRPGGKVLLLEHVLSANRVLARLMDTVNPLVVRLMGANINRKTVDNVVRSGLVVVRVTDLAAGIFKLIEARKSIK